MLKNLCTILALLFFISSISFSQTTDSKSSEEKNSLQKHSWSLQFAVGSNLAVQSFDGLMFSVKYHFSKKTALRFGVGFKGGSNDAVQSTSGSSTPISNNNENFFFAGSFLFYPKPEKTFIIYFGAGPRAGYNHNLDEHTYSDDTLHRIYSDEVTSWAVGLQLNLGAEWFATKEFSLFAEYSAYGTYGKTKRHEINPSYNGSGYETYDYTTTDWYFNGTTARLGLSVYF